MQLMLDKEKQRELLYQEFMNHRAGGPNDHYFACILSSYVMGMSAMPLYLGLRKTEFEKLVSEYFPGVKVKLDGVSAIAIDDMRTDEYQDILNLLMGNKSYPRETVASVADILAAGCMGSDHLWQDLGLWSRNDLSEMIENNFTSLYEKNTKNMKWKRFFYKQLCEGEGVYVCRSPSCEVCSDYKACFEVD